MTSGYAGIAVVHDVDLAVEPGEIVSLLGRNGMGKSTLLNSVFGTVSRLGGTVRVDGRTIPSMRPEAMSAAGASLLPEDRGTFPSLSISDNLELARRSYRPVIDPRDVFPLLTERSTQLAGTLSGGQQQQLGIARAVLAGSAYICVDELTQGLQPSVVEDVFSMLRHLAESGIGILMVDQNPEVVAQWSDRVLVMEGGRIVLNRTVDAGIGEELNELLSLR
ncbi:ABC transporter ATP-binding protein [Citricoccus sp. GCM10030269]|uniref:ABC transporter ATP-binding protein n=1 Tax=Citricoccus sp. GCM10030269 TaxID=3273388 RepID=UPI0036183AB5